MSGEETPMEADNEAETDSSAEAGTASPADSMGRRPRRVRRPRASRESRSVQLAVRYTPSEWEQIEARAEAAGLGVTDYVRVAAVHALINSTVEKAAIVALERQGAVLRGLLEPLELIRSQLSRGSELSPLTVERVVAEIRQGLAGLSEAVKRL
ncbi:plasmid mobilization protein [Acidiphilium acidophilum]|uniref:Uncharacterized protein n=1 Tax=Acidiphilium acidophilum TaxID=76588 RepID=A0AAW9DLB2_ACIAO|nr:hypothetical protein [Acidiphilium acidophilum]MDX5929387.1 hypothetical protein [Acidiphilium acidophilum]